jgi:4-carboxymuconolactone decarboxylase
MEQVYGPGSSKGTRDYDNSPFLGEVVRHLFGDIWTQPALSMRDKRLLVIGATTMLNRPDLIAVQVAGAIVNGELTDQQLDELAVLMMFYAGVGTTTGLLQGIGQAKARAKDMMKPA